MNFCIHFLDYCANIDLHEYEKISVVLPKKNLKMNQ